MQDTTSRREINWQVGVTAVPARARSLLPRTLRSLAGAGFTVHRLFFDGSTEREFGIHATVREPAVGPQGNMVLALWEMFYRDRFADRYALFQDDIAAVRNLRPYLDAAAYPDGGYWNLSTQMNNHHRGLRQQARWFPANPRGIGGCGLVFDNRTLRTLLSSPGLVEFAIAPDGQYPRFGDGAIATALHAAGVRQYCHWPSLLGHTGVQSTVMPGKTWPDMLAESFPGEEQDAMEWLQ